MKRLLCIALLAAASLARADDLGEANRLLAAKSYDKALPIYQRLADAGNPEAQMRLGEMYWFGDGTRADLAKAKMWFERSAAKGNADAAASLEALKRRETRGNEIAYWTTTYAGADMVSGKFACKRPAIPTLSKSNEEIKQVTASIDEWRNCYNGFVANVNDALPPGKRIPADVLDMMTPAEASQAQRHLDQVYNKLTTDAANDAATFAKEETSWRKATEAYVLEQNQNTKQLNHEMMMYKQRNVDTIGQLHRDPRPPTTSK
jgi:hypothetical protein